MKKILIKTMLFVLLLTQAAHAYDVDTHFYGTYSMARFAGIRHEVALKIATGTQWMDESYMSDPVSMIILAPVGMKKRRLLHFPGSRIANALTIDTLPSQIDPSSKVKLKTFTETEADHEFASELFTEGLKKGDLMTAAAGIHTLEDSFAHAGTISELGHAHFWHHPDRPYVDEASVDKYFQMTRAVFKAMVAIRQLMPINGIDMQYRAPGATKLNYEMNARELADLYGQIPEVRTAISRKILNDPGFVRFTLNDIFGRARRANYIGEGYENYVGNFTAGQDSFAAAYNVAKSMPRNMIRADKILADEGRPALTSDYILSLGGLGEVLSKAIYQLMDSIVPRPLDAYHKFEKEEDGPIWVEEGKIRVANMRTLLHRLYGVNVFFVENNTKDQAGFALEMSKAGAANRVVPRYNVHGVELASYSGAEKYKFNHTIFNFLFPLLSEHLKTRPGEIDRMAQLAVAVNDSEASFLARTRAQLGALAHAAGDMLAIFSDIRVRYNLAKRDLVESRITPGPFNKYYTVPSLLDKKVKDGTFAALISYDEVQALIDRK